MGKADYFAEGEHNKICDQCARKFKSSDTRKQWDGLIVCHECYDARHPQDFVRGIRDKQSVPFSRPQRTPNFTREIYVDENGEEYVDDNAAVPQFYGDAV